MFKVAQTGFNLQGPVSQVKMTKEANERRKVRERVSGDDILQVLEGKFGASGQSSFKTVLPLLDGSC